MLGGLGFDFTSKSHFTIPQVSSALADFSKNFLEDNPVDIYASDACFMQMAEVANEFYPHVQVVIGSSQQENYQGWPYREILQYFRKILRSEEAEANPANPAVISDDIAYNLALEIPQLFKKSYYDHRSRQGVEPQLSISSLRPGNWHQHPLTLAQGLNRLGDEILKLMKDDPSMAQRMRWVGEQSIYHSPLALDLYYFTSMLTFSYLDTPSPLPHDGLTLAIMDLQDLISQSIISYGIGKVFRQEAYNSLKALSLWFPRNLEDFKNYAPIFAQSRLYQEIKEGGGQWLAMLEKIYQDDFLVHLPTAIPDKR